MKKLFLISSLVILFFITSCTNQEKIDRYTFFAMDTVIQLAFYNEDNSQEYAKEVEEIYLKYDAVSDDFQKGLQEVNVYDLNDKRIVEVNDELKELLEFSLKMQKDTNGYFNPFIGRLSHLWKDALSKGELVEEAMVLEEKAIMDETFLKIEGNRVELIGDGNVDLGGVAKGYATSKVKEYLDSVECTRYMLDAGASNIVLGNKNGEPFKIGFSKAIDNGYFCTLSIKEKAIGTSSIREQKCFIDGKYYSHLLNPKTGYPATNYETLSIFGEDSKELDVYSTACFSMEVEELIDFLDSRKLDYIISKDNQLFLKSKGVEQYE